MGCEGARIEALNRELTVQRRAACREESDEEWIYDVWSITPLGRLALSLWPAIRVGS
jgi:hypothetical protein